MANDSNSQVLAGLYPFLDGPFLDGPKRTSRHDGAAMSKALLESVRQKVDNHREVVDNFFANNAQAIVEVAHALARVYRSGGRLYTMGNGGSSCDAAHVAVEFLHPVTTGRPALTAIDLSADRTMLSAVANDVGFDNVFVRQIIALGRKGDALLGLSTSGNSANLVKAFIRAKQMGIVTIGLAGKTGGEMKRIGLDHCLLVETDSIHRIQECHVILYHVLWDLTHTLLAEHRGAGSDASSEQQEQT
jgi:D-sedoheptulose 7-phosphate isomerase